MVAIHSRGQVGLQTTEPTVQMAAAAADHSVLAVPVKMAAAATITMVLEAAVEAAVVLGRLRIMVEETVVMVPQYLVAQHLRVREVAHQMDHVVAVQVAVLLAIRTVK